MKQNFGLDNLRSVPDPSSENSRGSRPIVSVRVHRDLLKRLKEFVDADYRSQNKIIYDAIEDYISRNRQQVVKVKRRISGGDRQPIVLNVDD